MDVETARIMVSRHFNGIVETTPEDWGVVEIDTAAQKVINLAFM